MLPMEKARYRAKAVAAALGKAGTGTVQIGIAFEVVDGDHKGTRHNEYFFLSEAAAEKTLDTLRTCGWTGADPTEEPLPGLGSTTVEIVCEPEIVRKDNKPDVDEETGEVRRRLRIAWVNQDGGIQMKTRLEPNEKGVLSAKFKGLLAKVDAKRKMSGAKPPPTAPQDGPPPGHPAGESGPTGDVPF